MQYDLIVIGGGPGGYTAAIRAAQEGMRVALIEERRLGGTCANRGCIPTKVYAHSAQMLIEAKEAEAFGLTGTLTLVPETVRKKKDAVVKQLTTGIGFLMKKNRVKVIEGRAVFIDQNTIEVGENSYTGRHFIIATGSKVMIPPIPGADLPEVMVSDKALELEQIPQKLAIIGAGVVGLEFASIYRAFGSEVTIIDVLPRLLPMLDRDISALYQSRLVERGIKFQLGASVKEIREGGRILIEETGGETALLCDSILLAAGRMANINGIDALHLETDKKGIVVNTHMETSVNNIYCVGDANGICQLAHAASYQAEVAVDHILEKDRKNTAVPVPSCIFTVPELAWVGQSEAQAKEQYKTVFIGKFPYAASGRALSVGAEEGLVKVVAEGEKARIVGLTILGRSAAELIQCGTMAIKNNNTLADLQETIFAHPTISECIKEGWEDTMGRAVHK